MKILRFFYPCTLLMCVCVCFMTLLSTVKVVLCWCMLVAVVSMTDLFTVLLHWKCYSLSTEHVTHLVRSQRGNWCLCLPWIILNSSIKKWLGVKKSKKISLVFRARQVQFLLVLLSINLSEMYCQINLHWIFHLSTGHWVKIYACPNWNLTCPGLQDKRFFLPLMIFMTFSLF